MTHSSLSPEPADLDRVLATFFQAELPQRWPDSPLPASVSVPGSSPLHGWHTRLTLAASFAALCGLGFALSYAPSGSSTSGAPDGGLLDKGTAGPGKLNQHIDPDKQPILPMK